MQITRQSANRVRINRLGTLAVTLSDDELEQLAQAIADFQFSEEDS